MLASRSPRNKKSTPRSLNTRKSSHRSRRKIEKSSIPDKKDNKDIGMSISPLCYDSNGAQDALLLPMDFENEQHSNFKGQGRDLLGQSAKSILQIVEIMNEHESNKNSSSTKKYEMATNKNSAGVETN